MLASGSNEKVRQVAGERSRPRAESACELSASSVRSTFCRRSRARFGLCGGCSGRRETRCPRVTVGDWPGQNDAGFHLPVQPGAAAAGRRLATDRRSTWARGARGGRPPTFASSPPFRFSHVPFQGRQLLGLCWAHSKIGREVQSIHTVTRPDTDPAADVQDQSGLGDAAGGPVWTRRWPADGMTIAPGAVRSAGHRWRNLPVV